MCVENLMSGSFSNKVLLKISDSSTMNSSVLCRIPFLLLSECRKCILREMGSWCPDPGAYGCMQEVRT